MPANLEPEVVNQVANNIEIQEVILSRSNIETDYKLAFNTASPVEVDIQSFKNIRKIESSYKDDKGDKEPKWLYLITSSFGIRRVDEKTKDKENPTAITTVEAEFTIIYSSADKFDSDALEGFANVYSIPHAWPYWREYVDSSVRRMKLPYSLPTGLLRHKTNKKE